MSKSNKEKFQLSYMLMVGVAEIALSGLLRLVPSSWQAAFAAFALDLQTRAEQPIPLNDTIVYAQSAEAKKCFPEHLLLESASSPLPDYSLVCTCRNEAGSIETFLDSVARQSHMPKEIVICDGGSTDGTPETIRRWFAVQQERGTFLPTLQLLEGEQVNIAEGRNRAAEQAFCELLLFTDIGATLDKKWAEYLCLPFVENPGLQVAMGWYRAVGKGMVQKAVLHFLVPRLAAVDPKQFLPSARSLAMKKALFLQSGGYPTHLSFAAEDSLFDLYLKSLADRVVFVPDAIVHWHPPERVTDLVATIFRYARGDAEAGVLFGSYYVNLLPRFGKILFELVLAVLCLELLLLFPNTFLAFSLFVVVASLTVRTVGFVRSYSPCPDCATVSSLCAARCSAVLLMAGAQTIGFAVGLQQRQQAMLRKYQTGREGDVIVLLQEAVASRIPSREYAKVKELLAEGFFVTTVFARFPEFADEFGYILLHPRLEQYKRSGFSAVDWLNDRSALPKRSKRVIDLVDDAFSRELAAALAGEQSNVEEG